jgi:hypothetical protein
MDRRFDVVKVSNGRLEQKKNEETIVLVPPREISNNLTIRLRYIYTSWVCIATCTQLHWKKITNCILWKQGHRPKLEMSLAFNNKGVGSQFGLKLNLNMIYVTTWKCKAYLFATKGYSYLTNLTYQHLDKECGIALIWHWRNQRQNGNIQASNRIKNLHSLACMSYHLIHMWMEW